MHAITLTAPARPATVTPLAPAFARRPLALREVTDHVPPGWGPDPAEIDAVSRRILAVHAHPDDEASKGAATIARATAAGARAALVTLTDGSAGEVLNPEMVLPPGRTLAAVRRDELAQAAAEIGFGAAYLLGYRDTGLHRRLHAADPTCFAHADRGEALRRLVRVIRAERPHVILGYDRHDYYPHPDHVAAHHLTVAAFAAAAHPAFGPSLGAAWAPQALYFFHWTDAALGEIRAGLEADHGWSPVVERPAPAGHAAQDGVVVSVAADSAHARLARRRALAAHASQIPADSHWHRWHETDASGRPVEHFVLARSATASPPSPTGRPRRA